MVVRCFTQREIKETDDGLPPFVLRGMQRPCEDLGCFLSHAKLPWHLSCRVLIFSRNHCYCTTISWWAAGVVGEQASWEVAGSRGPSRCRGSQQVVVGASR